MGVQVPGVALLPVVLIWMATFAWLAYAVLAPVFRRVEQRVTSRMARRMLWRCLAGGSVEVPARFAHLGAPASWSYVDRRRVLDALAPEFEAELREGLAAAERDIEALQAELDNYDEELDLELELDGGGVQ